MKNLICILCAFVLLAGLVGCRKAGNASDINSDISVSESESKTETSSDESSLPEVSSEESKVSSSAASAPSSNLAASDKVTNSDSVATSKPSSSASKPSSSQKPSSSASNPSSSQKPTATPSSTVATSSEPASQTVIEPTAQMISDIKTEFLALVNAERNSLGISPLAEHSVLTAGADVRAEECFTLFSHTRPNGESCFSLFKEGEYYYPYTTMGENITKTTNFGTGYVTDDKIFTGTPEQIKDIANILFTNFKNSSPHYSSMISTDFTETGIGIATRTDKSNNILHITCTQIFGSR